MTLLLKRPLAAIGALLFALSLLPVASHAQAKYPPEIEGARTEVYKTIGDVELLLWIFEPSTGPKTDRPAIVFYFGGGWNNGSPVQF